MQEFGIRELRSSPHFFGCNFAKKEKMDELLKYFPELTEEQRYQFQSLPTLYTDWNEKINVISRKDISNIFLHHILHSLSIAKFLTPAVQTKFLDLGTGGGFPGIPLAILWPDCTFHLIDRIGKKINVAMSIAQAIGLKNVTFQHGDIGECREKFDYVVSRAVMPLDKLIKYSAKNISPTSRNEIPNGLICLKGGELSEEIGAVKYPVIEIDLKNYFSENYFETKELVYVEIKK